mgnify:CR=1 FL=1
MKALLVLLPALLLTACVGPRPSRDDDLETPRQVHVELVRGLLNQSQFYAALAHIQQARANGDSSNELRYLEAEALRRLQRAQSAETIYRELLKTDLAAQGYQGLGLLSGDRDATAAVGYLRKAAKKAPTDAGIRNDLGYALMLAARYPEALAELSTAAELAPGDERSANNLIVLMVLMDDETSVRRLAQDAGVDAPRLAELRRQAQSLKKPVRSRG